jgi:CRISPR-associated endonuclease/helicase Cas3
MQACLAFWGKTGFQLDGQAGAKPVLHHLLDVASVAKALLETRPQLSSRLARMLGIAPGEVAPLISFCAGLHDLGKFSRPFQSKMLEYWPQQVLGQKPDMQLFDPGHWKLSAILLNTFDIRRLTGGVFPSLVDAENPNIYLISDLTATIAGHHGRPPEYRFADGNDEEMRKQTKEALCCHCIDAALIAAQRLCTLTCVGPTPDISDETIKKLSFVLNGIITVADWVGSDLDHFPIKSAETDIQEYWDEAQRQARDALAKKGLMQSEPNALPNFTNVGMPTTAVPRPMQVEAGSVQFGDGPQLFIIEDTTGSGKTEAAMLLAARMMAVGKGEGIYFALPTMATANAMHRRLANVYTNFYEPQEDLASRPSLVLAHGKSSLADRLRDLKSRSAGGEEPVTRACNAWIADSRRTALFAEMGAGTIDQAFMAVLPKKFLTLRHFALANRILVIDEAHSFDAYMGEELKTLLHMQAMNGGSAIVLSATLAGAKRQQISAAFQAGLAKPRLAGGHRKFGRQFAGSTKPVISQAYPLLTKVNAGGVMETQVAFDARLKRSVKVGRLECREDGIASALAAATSGAAVAIICNAVDEAIHLYNAVRERMESPELAILFHARFTVGDRMDIENRVLSLFGKTGREKERAGHILVATQVIEQSLDLDFDLIISDLAPIDLLIQRAGRLWRHMEERPAAGRPLSEAQILIVSPDPDQALTDKWLEPSLGKAAFIYRNAGVMWRSAKVIFGAGRIETPSDFRPFVEAVYDDATSIELPQCLTLADQKSYGEERGQATQGKFNVIKLNQGYLNLGVGLSDNQEIGTRLGEKTVTVRLARNLNGRLKPFYQIDDAPTALRWELSEVTIRESLYRGLSPAPDTISLADIARKDWPEFEQKIEIYVVGGDGVLQDSTGHGLTYHGDMGLIRLSP